MEPLAPPPSFSLGDRPGKLDETQHRSWRHHHGGVGQLARAWGLEQSFGARGGRVGSRGDAWTHSCSLS